MERKEVHRLCRKYGLQSKSQGKEGNRVLSVTKRGRVPDEDRYYSLPITPTSQSLFLRHLEQFPPTKDERIRAGLLKDQPATHQESDQVSGRSPRDRMRRTNTTPVSMKWTEAELNKKWAAFEKYRNSVNGVRMRGFQETLPVTQYRDEILSKIASHQVLLISGETGCGKTTQVPQFILDDCWQRRKPCRIVCTQPRRLAAIMIAARVAEERGEAVGESVGYRIMLEKKEGPNSVLIYATTGTILRSLTNDAFSHEWTHLIIDEIHERDHFSDFLLILVRDLLPKFPELKVILMSATLHKELFIEYFGNCPSFHIKGRMFPVHDFYLEDIVPVLKNKPKSTRSNHAPYVSSENRSLLDQAIETAFFQVSEEALTELESLAGTWVVIESF